MTGKLPNLSPEQHTASEEFKSIVASECQAVKVADLSMTDMIHSSVFERWSIYCFESVSSTMDVAACLSQTGEPEIFSGAWVEGSGSASGGESLVVAQAQTKGRGREARAWHSEPAAGLYVSYLFYPDSPPEKLVGFSLTIGLAVWQALAEFGATCLLKWPNDVLAEVHDGKLGKVAGVLIETSSATREIASVRAGIGINLNQKAFPPDVPGINLSDLIQGTPDYYKLLAVLSARISETASLYFDQGFSVFQKQWEHAAFGKGHSLQVHVTAKKGGVAPFVGIVHGLAPDGGLIVKKEDSGEEVTIYSGEVEWNYASGS